MRSGAATAVVAAGLVLAGCGNDDDNDGIDVPGAVIAGLESADSCRGADSADDPAGDSTAPFRDLRRVELRITQAGVCVRWTTDAQALVGTTFSLGMHGPFQKTPGGAVVSHGYSFDVELTKDGAEVTSGLADPVDNTPNVLDAQVGQSGHTVSTFVPRKELDRPPGNVPDRPPFPGDPIIVEVRVLEGVDERIADAWPDDPESQAAYVDGKICGPPCSEPAGLFQIPQPG